MNSDKAPFKGTPLRSGRVTHLKYNIIRKPVISYCGRVYGTEVYLVVPYMTFIGWQFI